MGGFWSSCYTFLCAVMQFGDSMEKSIPDIIINDLIELFLCACYADSLLVMELQASQMILTASIISIVGKLLLFSWMIILMTSFFKVNLFHTLLEYLWRRNWRKQHREQAMKILLSFLKYSFHLQQAIIFLYLSQQDVPKLIDRTKMIGLALTGFAVLVILIVIFIKLLNQHSEKSLIQRWLERIMRLIGESIYFIYGIIILYSYDSSKTEVERAKNIQSKILSFMFVNLSTTLFRIISVSIIISGNCRNNNRRESYLEYRQYKWYKSDLSISIFELGFLGYFIWTVYFRLQPWILWAVWGGKEFLKLMLIGYKKCITKEKLRDYFDDVPC